MSLYGVVNARKSKVPVILLTVALLAGAVFGAYQVCMRSILYPLKYTQLVEKYSAEYGLEKTPVYAIINSESSFKPDAVSSADARGLMQITPETFGRLQTKTGETLETEALFEPETAIKYGCLLLSLNLKEFKDTDVAVAAYHAGRKRVAGRLKNTEYSADGNSLDTIPYKDTAAYVKMVAKAQEVYKSFYRL